MKLSVIVPVYNTSPKYLGECLHSLAAQTYNDCEFLLVDDGSSPEAARFLDDYAQTDSRFRVFHKENGGVSSARNLGMENASGDFIGFADGDDILEPGALELCADALAQTGADLCVYRYRLQTGNKPLEPVALTSRYTLLTGRMRDQFMAGHYFGAYIWNKFIRREIALSDRFRKDIPLQEDLFYVWEILPRVKAAVYMEDALYRYRIHAASAVHSSVPERWLLSSELLAPLVDEAKAEKSLSAPTMLERTFSGLCKSASETGKGYTGDKRAVRSRIREVAKALRAKHKDILTVKSRLALVFLLGFTWTLPLAFRLFRLFKKG